MNELRAWWRRVRCTVFGWHRPDYSDTRTDGVNTFVTCRFCGFRGMLDSQGNLF